MEYLFSHWVCISRSFSKYLTFVTFSYMLHKLLHRDFFNIIAWRALKQPRAADALGKPFWVGTVLGLGENTTIPRPQLESLKTFACLVLGDSLPDGASQPFVYRAIDQSISHVASLDYLLFQNVDRTLDRD
jgi:hypothetical protein